ncbi:hypothetical protein IAT38_005304 [Cryptococcus sp. DSM 104549]
MRPETIGMSGGPSRSRQLEYASDSDDSSTTSSSGNESFSSSSSSSRASPAFGSQFVKTTQKGQYDNSDGDSDSDDGEGGSPYHSDSTCSSSSTIDRTPRRLARRKILLYECLECCTILEERARGEMEVQRTVERWARTGVEEGVEAQTNGKSRRHAKGKVAKAKGKGKAGVKDGGADRAKQAWQQLVKALDRLHKNIDHEILSDKIDCDETKQCLRILHCILETRIRPMSMDNNCIWNLGGLEHRAAREIRVIKPVWWQHMSGTSMSLEIAQDLSDIPGFLILRLARFALAPSRSKTYLDLSHLPYLGVQTMLEEMDLPYMLELFGSFAETVTHLELSNNNIAHFPRYPVFPFPNIQVLNLSSNHLLSTVPYPLIHLPHLRRIAHRHTQLTHPREGGKTHFWGSAYPRLPTHITLDKRQLSALQKRTIGAPALVELAILVLARQRTAFTPSEDAAWLESARAGLPPHLESRLGKSYVCDRCYQLQIPPSPSAWTRAKAEPPWDPGATTGWQLRKKQVAGPRTATVWLGMEVCPACLYHILAVTSGR